MDLKSPASFEFQLLPSSGLAFDLMAAAVPGIESQYQAGERGKDSIPLTSYGPDLVLGHLAVRSA